MGSRLSSSVVRVVLAVALAIVTVPVVAVGGRVDAAPGDPSERFVGLAGEEVGTSVDRDGDLHLIGGNGVAYVVRRSGADWVDEVALTVPGGNPTSFGRSVAIDMADDGQFGVAVVNAPFDATVAVRAGSSHVFEFTPATGWVHVQSLAGDAVDDLVGSSADVLLLADDRTANIVVGASDGNGSSGSVISWIRAAGVASDPQIVTNPRTDGVINRFGSAVALDGDVLVVGALRDDPLATGGLPGAAFVYVGDPAGALSGGATMAWVETHRLSLCGVQALPGSMPFCGMSSGEAFGLALDVQVLDGEFGEGDNGNIEGVGADVIVVAAPYRSAPGGGDAGSVSVFTRAPGGDWTFDQTMFHENAGSRDRLGSQVAVDGRHLVATAPPRNGEDGAVISFSFNGVDWVQFAEGLVSGDGTPVRLGTGLAIDGQSISAGAPFDELVATAQGSVTEYRETLPPADFPPVAEDDAYTTWEGDDTLYTVWENDEDPDGLELAIAEITSEPLSGTATIEQGGYSVGYEPDPGFVGTDTFTYAVSDGGLTAEADVTMTVLPVLSIADTTVAEGDGIVEVTVTSSAAIADGATFEVSAADGTADSNDYTLGLSSYAIEPGGSTAAVSVTIADDDVDEVDETFTLTVQNVSGAAPTQPSATITITDDDEPVDPDTPIGEVGPPFDPPTDDGPTVGTIQQAIDEILRWLEQHVGDITGLLPDRDEFSDFVFANWPPALPDLPTLEWPDICAWLEENFDTERCDLFGFDRVDPFAAIDEITIQQGTTASLNVALNDSDPAGRVIYPTAASLPNDTQSLTGLTSVELDRFGTATITAAADYEGVTSFTYETCTAMGQCATAAVLVRVTAGPPPPVANPDAITIWSGERRPGRPGVDNPVRSGINLLANDSGSGLALTKLNDPSLDGHVELGDLGEISIGWGSDGDVSVESREFDPPVPTQPDEREVVVPYEVCDAAGECTASTLRISKTGAGPRLDDDEITVGIRRFVDIPVTDNDESGVRVVEIVPGPDDAVNLDPQQPPVIIDDGAGVRLFLSTTPQLGARFGYRACRIGAEPTSTTECGRADIVIAEIEPRLGPIAQDDTFTIGRFAHTTGFPLDVLGPEGGGADSSDRPVSFRSPSVGERLEVSWIDEMGTPDDDTDDVLRPFAFVTSLDQFSDPEEELVAGIDRDVPFRGLALGPLVNGSGADATLAPVPPAGAKAVFEYEICDVDLFADPPEIDLELCDKAEVTLNFAEEPPLAVDGTKIDVGLVPDGAGGWIIPASPVPVPDISGELRYLFGASAFGPDIASTIELTAEVIDTPAVDPITGRPNETARVGTREAPGSLVQAESALVFDGGFGPLPPGSDLYYETTISDDLLTGSAVSKVNFIPVDFRATATVITYDLGVDGFDTIAPLDDTWFTTPVDGPGVDWSPRIELTKVRGADARDGAELYDEDFGDYRLEVRANSFTGVLDQIRIVPDIGFEGIVQVPYEACATWSPLAAAGEDGTPNPAFANEHRICRNSFVLFQIDATQDGDGLFDFAPPGARLQLPFDDSIDPWFEFTIEDDLGSIAGDSTAVGDTSIGDDALAAVADLFDAAGATFDAAFSGSARIRLTAGVDSTGPYLDGSTTLIVDAAAAGAITAPQTLGGVSVDVSGVASADGTLSVQLGPAGTRYHLADLADVSGLEPITDLDLLVGAAVDLDAGIVSASPFTAARLRSNDAGGVDVDTTIVVPVRVEIPGSDDGTGEPIVLELEGRQEGGGLRIVGSGDVPVGAVLDGFGVSGITVDLTVDDTGTTGRIDAVVEVPALADAVDGAPESVPVRIDIAGSTITGTATATLDGLTVGPQGDPFLTITEGQVVATAAGDTTTRAFDLALEFDAASVELLPGNAAGSATITGVDGELSSTGPATLSFTSLTAGTADYTAISTGAGTLTIGGNADTPVLVLTNVTALDGDVSITIGRIEFYADGRVEVTAGCLAADVGLAETIGLGGILPFDVTSACLDGDVITVEGFFDFSLMDDFPFTPTVTIGDQTVDADSDTSLDENTFTFQMSADTLLPLDLGPIRVGIEDLDIDGLSGDGFIEIAGYREEGGVPIFDGTFTGELDVTTSGAAGSLPFGGEVDIVLGGEVTIDGDGTGVLDLDVDVDTRGFFGDHLELTDGAIRMNARIAVPSAPAEPGAAPIDVSVSLESVALAGVIRITGLETTGDSGGIPVTLTYADGELTVATGGGGSYTAGPFGIGDVGGFATLALDGDTPRLTGQLVVADFTGRIGDTVEFGTNSGRLTFDDDPTTPLFRVDGIAAWIPDPVLPPDVEGSEPVAELTVEFVEIRDDGSFTIGVITATGLDRLADRFGFGQLFPFTITGLRIDPSDPAAITTTVAGTFDLSGLEAVLPGDAVTATATLGDGADGCDDLGLTGGDANTFCFSVALDALGDLEIAPVDFGPLSIELTGLDVGGVVGSTSFEIAGWSDGEFDGAFTGDASVATDLGGALSADFAAAVSGTILPEPDGSASLALSGTVDGSLLVDGAGSASASATFELGIERSAAGEFTVTGPSIDDLDVAVCLELPGFRSGPDCDGVFARIVQNGAIWTATVGGDDGVDATIAGGAITVEGLTGTLVVDTTVPRETGVTGTLDIERMTALFGDVASFEVAGVDFTFDTDPGTPILEPVTIIGSLFDGSGTEPDDVLVALEFRDVRIASDGTFGLGEVRATGLDDAAVALGVADILPFTVSGLSLALAGDDLTAPEAVTIRTAGSFDLSALADFSPRVQIGDGTDNGNCDGLGVDPDDVPEFGGTFCFALRIDADGVHPVDLGPILLALDSVELGPFTFAGEIEIGGFSGGEYLPLPPDPDWPGGDGDVRGRLTASVAFDDPDDADDTLVDGEITLSLAADFASDGAGRTVLDLAGQVEGGFGVADVIELRGATIGFGMALQLDTSDGVVLDLLDASIGNLSADLVKVSVPGVFTVQAEGISLPIEEGILFRVDPYADDGTGGIGLFFGDGPGATDPSNPLAGWGGSIAGFEVDFDGELSLLDGFGTRLSAGSSGFPEFLPITIDELGFVFGGDSLTELTDALEDGERLPLADVLGQLRLRGSMSLAQTDSLPVNASVDGLEIDIAKLRAWFEALADGEAPTEFFITNLDGLFFGIEDLEVGPVKVSGGLGIGVAPTAAGPRFWGRILGGFTYQGYGFGIDLLVSEYGPLSIDVTAPAAIVLGQTGIVVAVTDAGMSFNSTPPSVCTTVVDGEFSCDDGSVNPVDVASFQPSVSFADDAAIAAEIALLAESWDPTNPVSMLPESFGVFLKGQVSHLAIAAFVQGEIELALFFESPIPADGGTVELPGVKLVGRGDLSFLGISLGNVVMYADYGDPLAPAWTIASAVANGGDLLDLLFPVGATQAFTVDTDGMAAASILGMRELVIGLIEGGLESPAIEALFAEPLNDLIEQLRREATNHLRLAVFGDAPDSAITLDGLRARLLDLLPGPAEVDGTGKSEIGLLLENAAADAADAIEALTFAGDVAAALFSELVEAAIEGDAVELPDGTFEPLTQAELTAKGQQIVAAFQEFLSNSPELARRVGEVVYEVANPAIISQSRIQFELFDVPIGEPALDSTLVINKEGVTANFGGSIAKLTATAATFVNAAGSVLIPLSLAVNDQTNFTFSFPSRIDDLLDPDQPVDPSIFDPRTGEWALGAGTDLYFLGMQVSDTDALIVPAGSADQVAAWEVATGRAIPAGNPKVPVRSALIDGGGVYANGELRIPEMLADPIGWLETVGKNLDGIPTDDPLALPGWFTDASTDFFATRPGGEVELFATAPVYDPAFGPVTEPKAWTWDSSPYLVGDLGVNLLGYSVASGALELTEDGALAEIEFPFLNGPVQAQIENVVLRGQEAIEAKIESGQAGLDDLVRWPTIAIDETITVGDVQELLASLGIDDPFPVSVSDTSSLRLRAFSPLHHLVDDDPDQAAIDDPIRATGGFEITVAGAIDGLVAGDLTITLGLGDGASLLPSLVRVEVNVDELDLGGVVLSDARLVTSFDADDDPQLDVEVRGSVTIPAIDRTITFEGSLSDGVLSASTPTPVEIGPLTVTAPGNNLLGSTVTLRRTDGGDYQLELAGDVFIEGWSGSASVDMVLGTGTSTLEVELTDFGRGGVELNGDVSLTLNPSSGRGVPDAFTLELAGGSISVPSLGIENVSVSGRITENGVESLSVSDISFDLGPGAQVVCADIEFSVDRSVFSLSGTAGVLVSGLNEAVVPGVPGGPGLPGGPGGGPGSGGGGDPFGGPGSGGGGPTPAGCAHDGFNVAVELSSDGSGRVAILGAPSVEVGGVSATLSEAEVTRTVAGVVRLRTAGSVAVLGASMTVSGRASLTVTDEGLDGAVSLGGSIPDLYGWGLSGSISLDIDPDPAQTRFAVSGTIDPPFVDGTIDIGDDTWIGVGPNPSFSLEVTADGFAFAGDGLELSGTITIFRAGGVMSMSIANGSFSIPGFGAVGIVSSELTVNRLTVSGDGAFDVDELVVGQIGTDAFRLVNARLDVARTSAGAVTFRLHSGSFTGSALNDSSFAVPAINISFSTAGSSGFNRTFRLPALDLGPALRTSRFFATARISRTRIELDQGAAATATVFGSSLTLRDLFLRWRSTGTPITMTGELQGDVEVLGRELADLELAITRDGGLLRLDLDSSVEVPLGDLGDLGELEVDGWLRSDGQFELSGSWSGGMTVAGVGASATGTMTLRNDDDGPAFDFVGSATLTGVGSGTARGVVDANDVLLVTLTIRDGQGRFVARETFTLPLFAPITPSITPPPPVFADVDDPIVVTADLDDPEAIPVYYLDVIDLSAPGAETISCTPPNGSLFTVGTTTAVACTASNDGGFGYTTFDVVVQREAATLTWLAPIDLGGSGGEDRRGEAPTTGDGRVIVGRGGSTTVSGTADPGSSGKLVMHSDPVELGRFVADAQGRWSLTFVVPDGVELGRHTIVVDRVVDGQRRLDHVAVEVQEPRLTPSRGLPSTGGGIGMIWWAAMLLATGLVLFAISRRRRLLSGER